MNAPVKDRPTTEGDQPPPGWWHGDHPTFAALTGFFTGLLFVVLVPAAFVGLLHLAFDDDTSDDLFPLVLLLVGVPVGLLAWQRTRRFGAYMLIGMVVTALIVLGVAGFVIWFMVRRDQ